MFYQAYTDEPEAQRARKEDTPSEAKELLERLTDSWPGEVIIGDARRAEQVPGSILRRVFREHDRPHRDCRNESWHVNGTLGRARRFSFAATFSLTAVNSSANPPDESSDVNNLSDVQWCITDNNGGKSTYYRISEVDHRAPVLLSALLAKNELGHGDANIVQAAVEQLNRDELIIPDQLMKTPATARFSDLELNFGKSFLKRLPIGTTRPDEDVVGVTKYHLHLEGCTKEHPSGNMEEEAKIVLDVVYAPRVVPMLDGDHGVIGHGDWKDDLFCYSFPHMRVASCSLRITRASDDLELVRELDIRDGTVWMDHRFGGVIPRSHAEANYLRSQQRSSGGRPVDVIQDRCTLRLFNEDQDCISVTRLANVEPKRQGERGAAVNKDSEHVFAAVQSGKSRAGYAYIRRSGKDATSAKAASDADVVFEPDSTKVFRSKATGILYAPEWKVRTPTYNGAVAELTLRMTFPEQEMVSTLHQPSVWLGTVSVEGFISTKSDSDGKPNEGEKKRVIGEGHLLCAGQGALQGTEVLLEALHGAATAVMEQSEVAAAGSVAKGWEILADGPAVQALTSLCAVASMQKFVLDDAQKIVILAMLGTYAYIFHHPHDRQAVEDALCWCYARWMVYYGQNPIDYRTLTLRAFMLKELGAVMHAKCGAWVPKEAAALDIVVDPLKTAEAAEEASEVLNGKELPGLTALTQVPTALDLAQLKALLDGEWRYESVTGSLSDVLIEQHVPVLWRNLMSKVEPNMRITVDREAQKIGVEVTTVIEESEQLLWLNGKEWNWRCPARGSMRSRACILDSGKQLYVESYVRQGVERTWYQFHKNGTLLEETLCYYRTKEAVNPAAWCVRTYKIALPPKPSK